MSMNRNHVSEGEPASSMGKLRNDAAESVGELREFLGKMQGKSPQEVLGAVANSGLVASTLLSAVLIGVGLFGLSAFSYFWNGGATTAKNTPAVGEREWSDPGAGDETPAAQPAEADPAANAGNATPSGDNTLDALGIGETKTAKPDENPRELDLDNLLDGVK